MGKRVTEEGESAQHDPRPDERRRHHRHEPTDQGSLHERRLEGIEEPLHGVTLAVPEAGGTQRLGIILEFSPALGMVSTWAPP